MSQVYHKEKKTLKKFRQQPSSIYERQTDFFKNVTVFYLLIAGNHYLLI